jgi:hypothetical protein
MVGKGRFRCCGVGRRIWWMPDCDPWRLEDRDHASIRSRFTGLVDFAGRFIWELLRYFPIFLRFKLRLTLSQGRVAARSRRGCCGLFRAHSGVVGGGGSGGGEGLCPV